MTDNRHHREVVSVVTRINVVQTLRPVYCKLVFVWCEGGITIRLVVR